MPQLGETVTEGMVTRWFKAVGEAVERDEPLFEISTDKVDSEVPSPASGVLVEILVHEGETVPVGTPLAVISQPMMGSPSAGSPLVESGPATAPPVVTPQDAVSPDGDAGVVSSTLSLPSFSPPPSPTPPFLTTESSTPITTTTPSPSSSAPTPTPLPTPTPTPLPTPTPSSPPPAGAGASLSGIVTSPIVRRLIAEKGINPSEIRGTGAGGRITRNDVQSHAATAIPPGTTAPPGTRSVVVASGAPAQMKVGVGAAGGAILAESSGTFAGTDEVIPFDNMRRRTAEHMVRSKATSPHTLISLEADYEAVEQVRRSHGGRFRAEEGYTLSYLPFAARAAVEALKEWPRLNASVVGDTLVVHHKIELGIAVDISHEGLIVPVVHQADDLNLRGMARRIHDLATDARTRRLTADDISGGTFSITNAGPFGTFMTVAIINQPQVAILSTDGVSRKPVVVTDSFGAESIAIHSMGILAMSFDHRAVDGAYVAAFLARMAEILAKHDFASEL